MLFFYYYEYQSVSSYGNHDEIMDQYNRLLDVFNNDVDNNNNNNNRDRDLIEKFGGQHEAHPIKAKTDAKPTTSSSYMNVIESASDSKTASRQSKDSTSPKRNAKLHNIRVVDSSSNELYVDSNSNSNQQRSSKLLPSNKYQASLYRNNNNSSDKRNGASSTSKKISRISSKTDSFSQEEEEKEEKKPKHSQQYEQLTDEQTLDDQLDYEENLDEASQTPSNNRRLKLVRMSRDNELESTEPNNNNAADQTIDYENAELNDIEDRTELSYENVDYSSVVNRNSNPNSNSNEPRARKSEPSNAKAQASSTKSSDSSSGRGKQSKRSSNQEVMSKGEQNARNREYERLQQQIQLQQQLQQQQQHKYNANASSVCTEDEYDEQAGNIQTYEESTGRQSVLRVQNEYLRNEKYVWV
jgi:hypothetical protein